MCAQVVHRRGKQGMRTIAGGVGQPVQPSGERLDLGGKVDQSQRGADLVLMFEARAAPLGV